MPMKPKRQYRQLLQDPLVRQMMTADGVCPRELETLLNEIADRLRDRGETSSVTYIMLHSKAGRSLDEQHSGSCSRLLRMGCSPTMHRSHGNEKTPQSAGIAIFVIARRGARR